MLARTSNLYLEIEAECITPLPGVSKLLDKPNRCVDDFVLQTIMLLRRCINELEGEIRGDSPFSSSSVRTGLGTVL